MLDGFLSVNNPQLAKKVWDWNFKGSKMVSEIAITKKRDLAQDEYLMNALMLNFGLCETENRDNNLVSISYSPEQREEFSKTLGPYLLEKWNGGVAMAGSRFLGTPGLIAHWKQATQIHRWFEARHLEKYGRPMENDEEGVFDYEDLLELRDRLMYLTAELASNRYEWNAQLTRLAKTLLPTSEKPLNGCGLFYNETDNRYDATASYDPYYTTVITNTGLLLAWMLDEPGAKKAEFSYTPDW